MTFQQAMTVLGLAENAGEDDIRRAYARRLKATNPEDDPEGFKELRSAYELMMRFARYHQADEDDADEPEIEEASDAAVDPAPDPSPVALAAAPPEPPPEIAQESRAGAEPGRTAGPANADVPGRDAEAHPDPAPVINARDIQAEHGDLCNRLAEALYVGADEDTLHVALAKVLRSPGLSNIDIYNRTESWLIDLLARTRPASDPLFDRAIDYFRWDEAARRRDMAADFILSVRSRIPNEKIAEAFLARVKDKRHEFNRAYRLLLDPPDKQSWLWRLWAIRHGALVERFVLHAEKKAPLAIEALNRDALDWWRRQRRGAWPWILGLGGVVGQMVFVALLGFGALMIARSSGWLPEGSSRAASAFVTTRAECERALEDLKSNAPETAIARADRLCRPELAAAPDSLLLKQRLGEIDLAKGDKAEAGAFFDQILRVSPNDPFGLFGKGLAASDAALMSEALARSPDVMKHFIALPISVPAVKPMEEAPASNWQAPPRPAFDTRARRIAAVTDDQMRDIVRHFRRTRTPVGKASLGCLVGIDGALKDCVIVDEIPLNEGVGEIALAMAAVVKFKPATLAGQPVETPLNYEISLVGNEKEQAELKAAEDKARATRAPRRANASKPAEGPAKSVPPPAPIAPPKPVVNPAMVRILAHEECEKLAEAVRKGRPGGQDNGQIARAERICRSELDRAPDALLVRQHVALIALAGGKAEEASRLFAEILAASPNDPYALYGKAIADLVQDPAADTSGLSEALRREPGVEAYFAGLPVTVPHVDPMVGEPVSHVAKRQAPPADTKSERTKGADDELMQTLLHHFGVRATPAGKALLNCLIRKDGALSDCVIVDETPYNKGMGEFAIAMAYGSRFKPARLNGEPVDNMPLNYTVQLVATKEELDRLKEEDAEADKPAADPVPRPETQASAP